MNWMTSAKKRVSGWKRKAEHESTCRMNAWNKLPKKPQIPVQQYPNPYNSYSNENYNASNQENINRDNDNNKPQISKDVLMLLGSQRRSAKNRQSSQLDINQKDRPPPHIPMVMKGIVSSHSNTHASMNHLTANRMGAQVVREDPVSSLQLSPSRPGGHQVTDHTQQSRQFFPEPESFSNHKTPQNEALAMKDGLEELVEELHILYFNDGHECDERGVRISIFPSSKKEITPPSNSACSVVTPNHLQRQQLSTQLSTHQTSAQAARVPPPVCRVDRGGYRASTYTAPPVNSQQSRAGARNVQSSMQQTAAKLSECDRPLTLFGASFDVTSLLNNNQQQQSVTSHPYTQQNRSAPVEAVSDDSRPRHILVSVSTDWTASRPSTPASRSHSTTPALSQSVSLDAAAMDNASSDSDWWDRCQDLMRSSLSTSLCTSLLKSVAGEVKSGVLPTTRKVLQVLYRALSDVNTSTSTLDTPSLLYTATAVELEGHRRRVATADRLVDIIRLVELVEHTRGNINKVPCASAAVASTQHAVVRSDGGGDGAKEWWRHDVPVSSQSVEQQWSERDNKSITSNNKHKGQSFFLRSSPDDTATHLNNIGGGKEGGFFDVDSDGEESLELSPPDATLVTTTIAALPTNSNASKSVVPTKKDKDWRLEMSEGENSGEGSEGDLCLGDLF